MTPHGPSSEQITAKSIVQALSCERSDGHGASEATRASRLIARPTRILSCQKRHLHAK